MLVEINVTVPQRIGLTEAPPARSRQVSAWRLSLSDRFHSFSRACHNLFHGTLQACQMTGGDCGDVALTACRNMSTLIPTDFPGRRGRRPQRVAVARTPHSIEAESSVLGGLLLDNGAWDRVGDVLDESDFYRYEHRLIFAAVCALVDASSLPTW